MTRTSTSIERLPPTRSIFRSSSAPKILACIASGISPISSSKRVPPFAARRPPRLERGGLPPAGPTLEPTRHDDLQPHPFGRFGEEVVRATAQRLGGCLPDTEAGHGNDRDVRRQLPARPDRIEPVAVG